MRNLRRWSLPLLIFASVGLWYCIWRWPYVMVSLAVAMGLALFITECVRFFADGRRYR